MRWLVLPVLGLFLVLFVYAEGDLPGHGEIRAPAGMHVSPRYIEESVRDTKTPNIVTAVLADYRGYDTLGETVVIFTAGLALLLILPRGKARKVRPMRRRFENPIVEGVSRLMVPFIQIFSLYVITHGHYGPGGGFQGGVILAAGMMLLRLTLGEEYEHRRFPPELAVALGSIGILIFAVTGLVPLAMGGEFLDYAYLPVPGSFGAELRYVGILIVEIGIGMSVWGILVTLFDHLLGREA